MGLVAFFYAILELLLDALRFSHDILLNAALWHRWWHSDGLRFHAFLPIDLIAVADGDFEFSFGFFLNVSHYTSLLVNQISVIADFSVIFLFSAFQKQRHS